MKELLKELKAIDKRLSPYEINFYCREDDEPCIELIYEELKVRIWIGAPTLFSIYSYNDDRIVHHCIYRDDDRDNFDLINTLYNNKDKIIEIILKYI